VLVSRHIKRRPKDGQSWRLGSRRGTTGVTSSATNCVSDSHPGRRRQTLHSQIPALNVQQAQPGQAELPVFIKVNAVLAAAELSAVAVSVHKAHLWDTH
jgi:hypothetical protein